MLPLNKIGSWGMIDSLLLNTSSSNFEISIPSILMIPSQISTNRNKAMTIELLPDPVRPTMPKIFIIDLLEKKFKRDRAIDLLPLPIFSPAFMLNETSIKTSGSSSLYFIRTALNSILPREGQSSAGLTATVLLAPSLCKVWRRNINDKIKMSIVISIIYYVLSPIGNQIIYLEVVTDPFYAYKAHLCLRHQSDSILKNASHLRSVCHSQTGKGGW